jgi:hypothetical protein
LHQHYELVLVYKHPDADIFDEDVPVYDVTKRFWWEALVKAKKV